MAPDYFDSTVITLSVIVFLPADTLVSTSQDTLVFTLVESLVSIADGTLLACTLVTVFFFYALVFLAGASKFAIILTATLRLLCCFEVLLRDVVTACFSTLKKCLPVHP